MADVFSQFDAKALLCDKHVLFLGDSNIRAQYKDLVWLLNSNTLVTDASLRRKLEYSYLGDKLVHRSTLHRGRDFQEVRQYYDNDTRTQVDFMFIPRCFTRQLEDLFRDFRTNDKKVPDVIVMNSCLWDLCRWGPNGVPEYKDNMVKLMRMVSQSVPKECLFIWTTALPIAAHVRGALLIKQIDFMETLLRFEIMEANTFARGVVVNHGFDVLDNHFYNRMQVHRRAQDGVHYSPVPVRFVTNLILTHISLSWGCNLPKNVSTILLNKAIARDSKPLSEASSKLPTGGIFSKINLSSPTVRRNKGIEITFDPKDEGTTSRRCKLFEDSMQETQESQNPGHSTLANNDFPQSNNQLTNDQAASSSNFTGPYRHRNMRNNKRQNPYSECR